MFYEIEKNTLSFCSSLLKACIVPRPIGWITSMDKAGNLNLAPYSYFNAIADTPPMIMFSTTSKKVKEDIEKDTLRNVEETKEFVVNLAVWDLREALNLTSAELDKSIDEIEYAKLKTLPSQLIKPPRIAGTSIQLECVHYQSIQLPVVTAQHTNRMVIARVVGIHVDENVMTENKIDVDKLKVISRLGYMEYGLVQNTFTMERPVIKP